MLTEPQAERLILDRYRVGHRLGAGASGTVYAAEDEKHSAHVVIKLFDGVADGFSAWNEEMRLITRLSHPSIVPCLDVGFDEKLQMWTLVFERQDGGSLRRWLSDPVLREQLSAHRILHDVASALLFAHKKGVIHRDVKPDNVLAQRKEGTTRWLLGDFGSGRFLSAGRVAPSLAGSVLYMAPEVQLGAATARSDQYSLGAMGIELLERQLPSPDLIEQFCLKHSGKPSLEGAIARLAQNQPESRYPSLADFLSCLEQLEPSMSDLTTEERLLLEYLQQRHKLSNEQARAHHRAWRAESEQGKGQSRPFADLLVEKKLLDKVTAKTLKAMRMGYLSGAASDMRSTLGLSAESAPTPATPAEESGTKSTAPATGPVVSTPIESGPTKGASESEVHTIQMDAETSQDLRPIPKPQPPAPIESQSQPERLKLHVGQSLGRYALEEVLGEGSTAIIYRSYHQMLQVPVAIKRFKPAALQRRTGARERILQEGQLMIRMDHPGIVRVLDIDEQDGLPYIVFEYVSELSLQDLLENIGRLPSERIAQIGAQVTAALAAAHGAGLLHRDVKPENILVRKDGQVKLADFGIATYLLPDGRAGDELAQAGLISGTPQYISPEQISTPAQIDYRADIYSLGATLYHAATGHPPFDLDTLDEMLNAHLSMTPVPLPSLVPGIDPELAQLIAQMLQKRPEDRPQSLTKLSENFVRIAERILHSEAVHRQNILATQSSSQPALAVDAASSLAAAPTQEAMVPQLEPKVLTPPRASGSPLQLLIDAGKTAPMRVLLLLAVIGLLLTLWRVLSH